MGLSVCPSVPPFKYLHRAGMVRVRTLKFYICSISMKNKWTHTFSSFIYLFFFFVRVLLVKLFPFFDLGILRQMVGT